MSETERTFGGYEKLVVCVAISIGAHYGFGYGMAQLPAPVMAVKPHKVDVRVVSPPRDPDPEPVKPPEPTPKPPDTPVVHERPRAPTRAVVHDVAPKEAPPPDHPAVTADTSDTPVFGVTMESTSRAGGTPVPVGNTTRREPTPGVGSAAAKPLAEPVAAYEVTKMPLPQGRCAGKYTEEAKQAAIEGTVVLDLVVGEDGRSREIQVVSGLSHGLTEAAIAALRACHFDPGEKNGAAVPVRIRGFKIRFVLQDAS